MYCLLEATSVLHTFMQTTNSQRPWTELYGTTHKNITTSNCIQYDIQKQETTVQQVNISQYEQIKSNNPVHQSSPSVQSSNPVHNPVQSSDYRYDQHKFYIRKKPNGAFNSLITYKNNIVSKQVTNVHEDTSPPCRDVSSLTTHVQYPVI